VKIVLLPGLDGTGVLCQPFVEHLPPDLLPMVVSYPPQRFLSYEGLLELVLARLPRDAPFVLLGESFSGPLALMAAASCPPGLKAVILCATFIRNPTWLRWSGLASLVHPFAFRLYPMFSAAKALLGRYSTLELRRQIGEAIGAVSPQVFAQRVRAVLRVDAAEKLASCPVPILYLKGARDFIVPGRNLREIQRLLPSVQAVTLDAPHMVLQTRPAESARAVAEFVRRVT